LRYRDRRIQFPGAQCVTLDRASLKYFRETEYVVCEKTDGERQMLMETNSMMYFLDRKNMAYRVGLNSSSDTTTLLDGELVVDAVEDGSQRILFLIFDVMVFRGRDVTKYALKERLEFGLQYVRESSSSHNMSTKLRQQFPLHFAVKDFYDFKLNKSCSTGKEDLKKVLTQMKYPHASDGFIFTPKNHPYGASTCKYLLKWKPAELNTVDFLVKVKHNNTNVEVDDDNAFLSSNLSLWVLRKSDDSLVEWRGEANKLVTTRGELKALLLNQNHNHQNQKHQNQSLNSDTNYLKSLNGSVWECLYMRSNERTGWVLHRRREDKDTPNADYTVDRVVKSILDPVTVEDILTALDHGS